VDVLKTIINILDVMLVRRMANIEKNCMLQYFVYYYNGAQRYWQFFQVGQLCQALILLGLAVYLSSTSASSVFMVLYIYRCIF